jgi:hypothetical protein
VEQQQHWECDIALASMAAGPTATGGQQRQQQQNSNQTTPALLPMSRTCSRPLLPKAWRLWFGNTKGKVPFKNRRGKCLCRREGCPSLLESSAAVMLQLLLPDLY